MLRRLQRQATSSEIVASAKRVTRASQTLDGRTCHSAERIATCRFTMPSCLSLERLRQLQFWLHLTVSRPRFHKITTFLKKIATPISCFGTVGNNVRQSGLSYLARKVCLLGCPVTECRSKTVYRQVSRPIRRSIMSMDIFDSGLFRRSPGNTKSFCRIAFSRFTMVNAAVDSGTLCSRPAFMRLAGTVHILFSKLISSQRAPSTSPVRAAVKIANSSARAATASRCRIFSKKPGSSPYGKAA